MKVLITGAAGFIGFHLVQKLVAEGNEVVGLDNVNDYYSTALKKDRLKQCGILDTDNETTGDLYESNTSNYKFAKVDLLEMEKLLRLFETFRFDMVVNLAAQAGIRYSTENPRSYVKSNVEGFFNILECCRIYPPAKLIFASSSSVYGLNEAQPFSTSQKTETPVNIYAASKKTNELMAHAYSHLYKFQVVGLRFFTVYGPWGRPDMAPFLFADAILNEKPINVYNKGLMQRDFTYIDDIVNGIASVISTEMPGLYQIYNIGNGKPIGLLHFIECLENSLDKKAKKEMKEMIPGDIVSTWANTQELEAITGYHTQTDIEQGVRLFVDWYKNYYKW